MKPEIEIAIRTIALADGIPAERVEAGIAAMKMGAGYETQELYSLNKITPLGVPPSVGSRPRRRI